MSRRRRAVRGAILVLAGTLAGWSWTGGVVLAVALLRAATR